MARSREWDWLLLDRSGVEAWVGEELFLAPGGSGLGSCLTVQGQNQSHGVAVLLGGPGVVEPPQQGRAAFFRSSPQFSPSLNDRHWDFQPLQLTDP